MINRYSAYFIGHIVELDKKQNIEQTGYGTKYRVRRIGIDDPDLEPSQLKFFPCMLPLTAGSGDGESGVSVNLKQGDMVLGLHFDHPHNQQGVIIGLYPRSVMVQYGGDVVSLDPKTASGASQEGDQTLPSYRNLGPKELENRNGKPEKRVADGNSGDLPSNTNDIDRQEALRSAVPEATGALGSGDTPGVSQSIVPTPPTTQTAADVLNRDPQSISQYGTRINNTPTAEQLGELESSGLTFTPNADGSPGGKVNNPNSLLGG